MPVRKATLPRVHSLLGRSLRKCSLRHAGGRAIPNQAAAEGVAGGTMQAPSKAPTTEVKPKFLLVTLGGRKDGRDHLMQVEMCASSGMQASEDARTMRGVATGNVQWFGQALGAKDTSREYICGCCERNTKRERVTARAQWNVDGARLAVSAPRTRSASPGPVKFPQTPLHKRTREHVERIACRCREHLLRFKAGRGGGVSASSSRTWRHV